MRHGRAAKSCCITLHVFCVRILVRAGLPEGRVRLASCVSASLAATGRRPCLKRSLHHLSHWRAHLPRLDHSKRGRKQGSTTQAVSSSYGLWGASLSPHIIAQVPYVSEKALVRDLCLSPPLTSQAEAHHLRGKVRDWCSVQLHVHWWPPWWILQLGRPRAVAWHANPRAKTCLCPRTRAACCSLACTGCGLTSPSRRRRCRTPSDDTQRPTTGSRGTRATEPHAMGAVQPRLWFHIRVAVGGGDGSHGRPCDPTSKCSQGERRSLLGCGAVTAGG